MNSTATAVVMNTTVISPFLIVASIFSLNKLPHLPVTHSLGSYRSTAREKLVIIKEFIKHHSVTSTDLF